MNEKRIELNKKLYELVKEFFAKNGVYCIKCKHWRDNKCNSKCVCAVNGFYVAYEEKK